MRCSIPGDYARVETDGSVTLLGRVSMCINTGGEKVYPEEVEQALREHAEVLDAVVVGVPDERFGSAVAAVVAVRVGAEVTSEDLTAHVRARLAPYKAPRHVLVADSVLRGPHGKADYVAARERVIAWLSGRDTPSAELTSTKGA